MGRGGDGEGRGRAGQMRLGKKILTAISARREEQRHPGTWMGGCQLRGTTPRGQLCRSGDKSTGRPWQDRRPAPKIGAEGMEFWLVAWLRLGLGPKEPKKCSQDCPSTVRFSDFGVIKKFMPTSRKENRNPSE